MRRQMASLLLFLGLVACGGQPTPVVSAAAPTAQPRIVVAEAPLQCVPYARRLTQVALRGDAWTWWEAAEGRYTRSRNPLAGAILVLARSQRLRLGHIAVVTEVRGPREIVVRHANWLNHGRIHLDTPVIDVSAANDWSQVRVWYTPGKTLGRRRYAVQGFILPKALQVSS